MTKTAQILRIEKISPNDGLGLRTVVFFKGCPLRCQWCSTPESQKKTPELCFNVATGKKCIYGKEMTVDEVMKQIEKDEIFYHHTGGGVTLSGGDVLVQADFAREVLIRCKDSGLHTMAELDMYGSYQEAAKILPYLDGFYIDIKNMDDAAHRRTTGVSNKTILANTIQAGKDCQSKSLCIRVPLIWDINDSHENILRTAEFCASLASCDELEFLPYHRLGQATYTNLQRDYPLKHLPAMSYDEAYERVSFLKDLDLPFSVKIAGKTIQQEKEKVL